MNQNRRKEVQKVQATIREVAEAAGPVAAEVRTIIEEALARAQTLIDGVFDRISIEDMMSDVEGIKDEEQEYYDNMPEGLQGSERGEVASENIENLEQAYNTLEELQQFISELDIANSNDPTSEMLDQLDSVSDKLSEAADALDEAQG